MSFIREQQEKMSKSFTQRKFKAKAMGEGASLIPLQEFYSEKVQSKSSGGKEQASSHCKQEGDERHVLTFVSTICRYIDNLITDSFIRTS